MKAGNVPTARVGPILGELIDDRWPFGGGPEVLADKVGCDEEAIRGIVQQENEGADFDLVDKLLCALGRPDVWIGQLADVYPSAGFLETCGLHSCGVRFPESKTKGHVRRYCSVRCRKLANSTRIGLRPGDRLRSRGRFYCGHKKTSDNTACVGEGKVTCLTCRREKNRVYSQRARDRRRLAAA